VRAKLGSIYRRTKKHPDGTVTTLPVWWIKYYRNGQAFRESSHSEDHSEAERLLKRRQGEIVTGKFTGLGVERIRVSELLDDVVQDYQLNRRKSLAQLASRLKKTFALPSGRSKRPNSRPATFGDMSPNA